MSEVINIKELNERIEREDVYKRQANQNGGYNSNHIAFNLRNLFVKQVA